MKLRIAALLFGIIFLAAGVAWHLSFLFDNDLLFGVFQVDSMHNKVHIGSGLLALVATSSSRLSRLYFKVFGSIYTLFGLLGFIFPDDFLAMQINAADNVLHVVLGLVAVMIGFKMAVPAGE